MFEARLVQGCPLKKVLETVKDLLLNEAIFECSNEGTFNFKVSDYEDEVDQI